MSRQKGFEIVIGQEYGHLTVLSELEKDRFGHIVYLTRYRCGNIHPVQRGFLRKPNPMCRECSFKYNPGRKNLCLRK